VKIKQYVPLIIIGIAVSAGLGAFGDFENVLHEVFSFPRNILLQALGLAVINYLFRYLRWKYYLTLVQASVCTKKEALVFTSGLAMALTPGKVGEISKAYLLRDLARIPVSVTTPVVIMERVTDLLCVALLSLGALMVVSYGAIIATAGTLVLTAAIFATTKITTFEFFLRLPLLKRWEPSLKNSLTVFHAISAPKPVFTALFLGGMAWISEGLALWVILNGLDMNIPALAAVGIYAVATLVGAVTLLPGGMVGTEGTMVSLLTNMGITPSGASAATILVRLCTLWFAFLLGVISLLLIQRVQLRSTATKSK
jgi:uncharacterized protein (TIRG00374 family)